MKKSELKQLIKEELIEGIDVNIGDYITKRINAGGGLIHGTQGYVYNKGHRGVQLTDEWGSYDKNRWYDLKGFKRNAKLSKQVSQHNKVLDVIKQTGNILGE